MTRLDWGLAPGARAFDRQDDAIAFGVLEPLDARGGSGTMFGSNKDRCLGRAAWRKFQRVRDRQSAAPAVAR